MLETLYKYAVDNNLIAKPGFKAKNVKYYISFSANGDFVGFESVENGTPQPLCPDIGSAAQGTTKSNVLAEKAEVILNLPEKQKDGSLVYNREQKQKFYLDTLAEAGEHDALFRIASHGFEKDMDNIRAAFDGIPKFKGADLISIKVDNRPLESSSGYLEWWEQFRRRLDTKKKSANAVRCFITGDVAEPMSTVPTLSGFAKVGGNSSGVRLICFDKDAYCSYGLKQAANTAVSEEAMTAVNAALSELVKKAPPPLAGAMNIHWYSEETEFDVTELPDFGFGGDGSVNDKNEQLDDDELRVQKMFKALENKSIPEMPKNRYYMMSLSGVNGRVMIRSYDECTYSELCENLRQWYKDIAIFEPKYGYRYPKLFGIYTRLLKNSKDKKKLGEKVEKELSGISPRIVYSIYHNTQLPDAVAVKALAYIRSDMYSDSEDNRKTSPIPDRTACQILKAWLNRRYRNMKKEDYLIMDKLNQNSPSEAYQTGRLMAVYAMIQNAALGDVGAGVVERYYTSACSSPALVMGKLATMSQYHLSKLKGDKPGLYTNFNKILEEITVKIGSTLPKTFSLVQQSEFALGYYFQRSQSFANKKMEG